MKETMKQSSHASLRSFLTEQLEYQSINPPLTTLIQDCYRKLLKQANNGQRGTYTHHQLQEKLQTIAMQILEQHNKRSYFDSPQ